MTDAPTATVQPDVKKSPQSAQPKPRKQPPYHVILLDDDDHSYEYVVEMLGTLFGHSPTKAFRMAEEVDQTGRVIVETTTLERAELKRDQIHSYGPGPHSPEDSGRIGSMRATVEPAGDAE